MIGLRTVAIVLGLLVAGSAAEVSAQIPRVKAGKGVGKNGVLPPKGKAAKAKAKQQAKQAAIIERLLQMSPREREAALGRLAPARRAQILRRLRTVELLSDGERNMLRGRLEAFADFAPDRQGALRGELQQLRRLTPEERRERLDSTDLREKFSDDERQFLEDVTGEQ